MSNIKFSYFNDGTNKAVAMNALKISEDKKKLTLYALEDTSFESNVELPDYDSTISISTKSPVKGIINIGEYITDMSGDSTDIIQNKIDELSDSGGGIVWLGSGVYYISGLTMKPKVSIVGNGETKTILYRLENKTITSNVTVSDDFHSGRSFIQVPVNCSGCSISNMTLYGGATIAESSDKSTQVAGIVTYNENNIINGINFLNAPLSMTDADGNSSNPYKVHKSSEEYTDLTPYKFCKVENVSIIGFSGSGLIVGINCDNIIINNVTSNMNRYEGFINAGTSIQSSNIELIGNGGHGLYDLGSTNQYNNIKVLYNGKFSHLTLYGVYMDGEYSSINNIICSFNYCTGVKIAGIYNSISSLLSNCNGGRSSQDENGANANALDLSSIILTGESNSIQGRITNSYNNSYKVALRSFEMDENANNCIVDLLVSSNSGYRKSIIWPEQSLDHDVYNDSENFGNNYIKLFKVV